MPIKYKLYPTTLIFALVCSVSHAALADPPARVGRLSYTEGTVSFHAGDQDEWSLASVNYPVTTGDAFWTEPNAKSEIQVGSIDVRMDQMTQMDILQLDDNGTRIELPQGVVNVHVMAPPIGGSMQVMTPVGEIDLVQPGTYHIDSGQPDGDMPSNQVQVTTLEGQVEIKGPRSMLEVLPGETALITGTPPSFALEEGNPTPFDDWALAREKREEASQSIRYVSPHMTGYEDLDRYGQWSNDPNYGAIWYPVAVDPEWAPYRYGHWAYVQPWGWTWVDSAPWGFAPFHYGRWVHNGPHWGWVPGEVAERPVYAPALVAFVGGSGWSISLSVGDSFSAVGWVPLAPREVFYPYYPVSVNYIRNVNITTVDRTVINNIKINNPRNDFITKYANQQSATVVPATAFTHGDPVHKSFVSVPHDQIAKAPITPTVEHLQPTASARAGGGALSGAAKAELPHPNVESNVAKTAGGQNAPINHMQETTPPKEREVPAETTAAPHSTPMRTPETEHEERQPEASHAPHPAANDEKMAEKEHPPAHAPGPPIRHPAAPAAANEHHDVALQPHPEEHPLPRANVPHPQQQTRIAPTPQGWQRKPAEPAAKHEAAPANEHDTHKQPQEEKREN